MALKIKSNKIKMFQNEFRWLVRWTQKFCSVSTIGEECHHQLIEYQRIKYSAPQTSLLDNPSSLRIRSPPEILSHRHVFPHRIIQNFVNFYILLTVDPNIVIVFFYQIHAQILYFNTFITLVYMFRALLRSSSCCVKTTVLLKMSTVALETYRLM